MGEPSRFAKQIGGEFPSGGCRLFGEPAENYRGRGAHALHSAQGRMQRQRGCRRALQRFREAKPLACAPPRQFRRTCAARLAVALPQRGRRRLSPPYSLFPSFRETGAPRALLLCFAPLGYENSAAIITRRLTAISVEYCIKKQPCYGQSDFCFYTVSSQNVNLFHPLTPCAYSNSRQKGVCR